MGSACTSDTEKDRRYKVDPQEAIESLLSDIRQGSSTTIPSFEWKFQRRFVGFQLDDESCHKIAACLSAMPQHSIRSLQFQNNAVGNEGFLSLAKALQTDSTAIELDISGNDIDSEGVNVAVSCLAKNITLRKVWCDRNRLSPATVAQWCQYVEQTASITETSIGCCSELDPQTLDALQHMLSTTPRLRHFRFASIENVGFTPSTLKLLVERIRGKTELHTLQLFNCAKGSIDCEPMAMIAPMRALGRLLRTEGCQLSTLELRLPVGTKGCEALAATLPYVSCLRSLCLSRCAVGNDGVVAMARALRENRSIKRLEIGCQKDVLSFEAMRESGLLEFASCLGENSTLCELSIVDLGMTNKVLDRLCQAIEQNKRSRLMRLQYDSVATNLVTSQKLTSLLIRNSSRRETGRQPRPQVRVEQGDPADGVEFTAAANGHNDDRFAAHLDDSLEKGTSLHDGLVHPM